MGGNREEGHERQPKEMAPREAGEQAAGGGGGKVEEVRAEGGGQGARKSGRLGWGGVGWVREGWDEGKGGEKGYESSLD